MAQAIVYHMQRLRASLAAQRVALEAALARNSVQAAFSPVAGILGSASATSRCITSCPVRYEDEKGNIGQGDAPMGANAEPAGESTPKDLEENNQEEAQQEPGPLSPGEVARQRAAELVNQGYTPRQAAWMSPDPEKVRSPKLSRKEAGSYGRPDMVSQYVKEVTQGMRLPKNVSMYNLDSAMPEILEPRCAPYDAMVAMLERHPEMTVEDAARSIGMPVVDMDAPKADQPYMTWTYRNVLVPLTVGESHPVNCKVTCEFHLRDLQAHYGLTDAGADYVAQLCDLRYKAETGVVRLVSDRFASREENRDDLERIVLDLVKEGLTKGATKKAAGRTTKARGKKAAAAASS